MRPGRRVGADVGADDHVAAQHVAAPVHVEQFGRGGERGDGAVRVGDQTGAFGPGPDAAEPAEHAQRGGVAAGPGPVGARHDDLDEVGPALGPFDPGDGDLHRVRPDGGRGRGAGGLPDGAVEHAAQVRGEELPVGLRAVEEFEDVEYVLEHGGSLVRGGARRDFAQVAPAISKSATFSLYQGSSLR